jgi:hypothetical protein
MNEVEQVPWKIVMSVTDFADSVDVTAESSCDNWSTRKSLLVVLVLSIVLWAVITVAAVKVL